MKTTIDYLLKIQSDDVIEATLLNTGQCRKDRLNKEFLLLAKAYAQACHHGVLNYLGKEASEAFRTLGKYLYEIIFTGDVDSHFSERVLGQYLEENKCDIRLIIVFQVGVDPELMSLPWEFLHHHKKDIFLATHSQIMFSYQYDVRAMNQVHGYSDDENEKLRVLYIHTHPQDLEGVGFIKVRQAIQQLSDNKQIEFKELKDLSVRQLKKALEEYKPHIFHFLGHGYYDSHESALALIDKDNNKVFWCDDRSFSQLFESWKPKLVILQSCQSGRISQLKAFSGSAAWLTRKGIPAVLAWRYPFLQEQGWDFIEEFYTHLAQNKAIDFAVQQGRNLLAFPNNKSAYSHSDFGTPLLWNHLKEGKLFFVDREKRFHEIMNEIERQVYVRDVDGIIKINALGIADVIGDVEHKKIVKLLRTTLKYLKEHLYADRFQTKLKNIYHYIKKLLEVFKDRDEPIQEFRNHLNIAILNYLKNKEYLTHSLDYEISLIDCLAEDKFYLFNEVLKIIARETSN